MRQKLHDVSLPCKRPGKRVAQPLLSSSFYHQSENQVLQQLLTTKHTNLEMQDWGWDNFIIQKYYTAIFSTYKNESCIISPLLWPLLSCAVGVEWAKMTFSNHNKQAMWDYAGSNFLIQNYQYYHKQYSGQTIQIRKVILSHLFPWLLLSISVGGVWWLGCQFSLDWMGGL